MYPIHACSDYAVGIVLPESDEEYQSHSMHEAKIGVESTKKSYHFDCVPMVPLRRLETMKLCVQLFGCKDFLCLEGSLMYVRMCL